MTGKYPESGLTRLSNGVFYGVTTQGGANDVGVVYYMFDEGELTVLHSFNYVTGAIPYGEFIQAHDGLLYGTSSYGGLFVAGTIFSVSPEGEVSVVQSTSNPRR